MAPGAVIVDVSIDQAAPARRRVQRRTAIRYTSKRALCTTAWRTCPGAVPITSTRRADFGDVAVHPAARESWYARGVARRHRAAKGVLVSEGAVTYAALAESLHLPYVPLAQALPA